MINDCGARAFSSCCAQALEPAGSAVAVQALLPLGMWDLSSPTWDRTRDAEELMLLNCGVGEDS